jgi:predicted transcriptional regulator
MNAASARLFDTFMKPTHYGATMAPLVTIFTERNTGTAKPDVTSTICREETKMKTDYTLDALISEPQVKGLDSLAKELMKMEHTILNQAYNEYLALPTWLASEFDDWFSIARAAHIEPQEYTGARSNQKMGAH